MWGSTLCVLAAVMFVSPFEESEFSGGATTAVILRLYLISAGLLAVAVVSVCFAGH